MFNVVVLLHSCLVLFWRHPVTNVAISSNPSFFRNDAFEMFDLLCHRLAIHAVDANEGSTVELMYNIDNWCAATKDANSVCWQAEGNSPTTWSKFLCDFSSCNHFTSRALRLNQEKVYTSVKEVLKHLLMLFFACVGIWDQFRLIASIKWCNAAQHKSIWVDFISSLYSHLNCLLCKRFCQVTETAFFKVRSFVLKVLVVIALAPFKR